MTHPLAALLLAEARGVHLPADGGWRRVPTWLDGVEAVLAFTGHAVFAVGDDVTDDDLERLGVDGLGAAHAPHVLTALAGTGWVDSLDVLLAVRPVRAGDTLVERPDLTGQARVAFARGVRGDVRVFGRPSGDDVLTVARGIAGLPEISFELDPTRRGHGAAVAFVRAGLAVLAGEPIVLAASAPGNVASLRTLLRAGFAPIASAQLLQPKR